MENKEVRRLNLRWIKDSRNLKWAPLAIMFETTEPWLIQIASKRTTKAHMGDPLARKVEIALGEERGWMDVPHFPIDENKTDAALKEMTDSFSEEQKRTLLQASEFIKSGLIPTADST